MPKKISVMKSQILQRIEGEESNWEQPQLFKPILEVFCSKQPLFLSTEKQPKTQFLLDRIASSSTSDFRDRSNRNEQIFIIPNVISIKT